MRRWMVLGLLFCFFSGHALGEDQVIALEGEVPEDGETHFFLPFTVPVGIAEIEVRHDDESEANILDWGLDDPDGFRGWGGGNTEPAIVGVNAASRSYVPGPLKAGTWEVVVGKAKIVERPARYAVEIILRDIPTLAPQTERSPYVAPAPLERQARWLAGDFHVHSRESGDAQPSIEDILEFAERRGLDFVMLSDHNTNSQLSWYNDAQAKFPHVLLLPGVEFTTYAGHANGIGARQWVDHRIGVRGATIDAAIRSFHEQGALFSINHPRLRLGDLCIGCAWDHPVDPQTIDAVEVRTGVVAGVTFWESLVARGAHAAALGGSDDHRGGIVEGMFDSPIGSPTTMVYADELSVGAILDGVRAVRTVVKLEGPEGPMIDTVVNGQRGKSVRAMRATPHATVTSGDGLTLRLIKNGSALEDRAIDGDPFAYEIDVGAPLSGEDRYRFEIMRGSMPVSMASYVWLQRPDAAANADEGCAIAPGATASTRVLSLIGLLILGAMRRRTRRAVRNFVMDNHLLVETAESNLARAMRAP